MRRNDIHKVLIIGSGPIIIGQACEFDYSGTQACKALRKLGYEIVLVNSNPATIMTDPETADVTYIEPLNVDRLTQIIEKERPDALLPNLGGQSGLNLCSELAAAGVLDKYDVKVIGVQVDAIERGEDRIEFKHTMESLGIEMARSEVAYSVEDALAIADKLGYPVVLRPAYTMGGEGGGLVYNVEELKTVCARGLQASMVGQVLVEESILGWEELELEVVRDAKNNMITVCFIENIDPLGVHTGDSFCSAPMLTISEEVQKRLQEKSYKICRLPECWSSLRRRSRTRYLSGRTRWRIGRSLSEMRRRRIAHWKCLPRWFRRKHRCLLDLPESRLQRQARTGRRRRTQRRF